MMNVEQWDPPLNLRFSKSTGRLQQALLVRTYSKGRLINTRYEWQDIPWFDDGEENDK